ncbi:pilus assembly protein TadG-related protein [Altererythrobacter arenosus]|uniref:Pilus assembly protein TadG-related protein n=1 Tax=Altererythrobacter arenosus TaxID=3032592 RepID=A0ABY8FRA4_9SPHN|nr:TadE/TadG family type IV pilus assembly protein [Altererythrobacter sp. CAU 1644]WFL76640.1 pilus assembly protein TadG-related protein [Altererythrobacter sp. CAU 1644]
MSTFMTRLAQDTAGNTLAIFAAALIPLTIMIGSGLDISITYMARAKLQNACDSAVLAGRQAMQGNNWNNSAEGEARKLFNFNFPAGTHGVQDAVFELDQDEDDPSQIVGRARGTVPTSLMNIFGYDEMKISAACDAKRDLGHNDVMVVLDVTGSMNDAPSNGLGTKIERLREGAIGLYRALDDQEGGSITRFGLMPYSHTVNVGRSLDNRDILVDQQYVDRERVCNWWGCNWVTGSKIVHISQSSWNRGRGGGGPGNRQYFRESGSACIEERPSIGNDDNPFEIDEVVRRADIDDRATNGNDELRQFGRYDPGVQEGHSQDGCPSEATRLQEYDDEFDFQAAVNAATARVTGGTYHDVGMLWGTRFLSRTGFFASDNPEEINDIPVNQHIVFMTDGMLDTGDRLYSAHGVERYQGRTQGFGSQDARHLSRFDSTCDVAKSMGITIWVIALDVEDTGDVEPCATSEAHFYTSDGSDLEEIFEAIGQGIGNLRLTR